MEEITMTTFQILSSYGGLGVALGYFMYKDFRQGQEATETNKNLAVTLEKLVMVINTLCK